MCRYRHLAFVFGGTGFPFGQRVSDELHILDLNRRHWRRCQFPNEKPKPVYGAVGYSLALAFQTLSLSLSFIFTEYDSQR